MIVVKIKAVFIDIDNTLLDFDEGSKASMKDAFLQYGLEYKEEFHRTFLEVNNELWERIERKELTKEGLYKVRWNMIFKRHGICGVDGETFEKDFHRYMYDSAIPVKGAKDILNYLSEKYRICIASNASYKQQTHRLGLADMLQYADNVFVSEEMGQPKPQKGFFDACFARLENVLPSECVMIGDSITADITGAKEYGMLTCLFDRNATHGDRTNADMTVTDLLRIKEFL